jgi:lipopolysaccharide export system permease protein
MSFLLFRYIGKQFFVNMTIAFAVVLGIAGLIDLVELVRRASYKESMTFLRVAEMAVLHLPYLSEKLLPYGIMIGTMMTLMKLTRSSELVVVRASGVSAWRFLFPAVVIAFLLGTASVVLLNPLASATLGRYEYLEDRYISESGHVMSVSSSGLWLRQIDAGNAMVHGMAVGSYILQAAHISQSTMQLSQVIIFLQDKQQQFIGRIDAKTATLGNGVWKLQEAVTSVPNQIPEFSEETTLPTELSLRQIQDSFADPETLSFWQLSSFIETLEKSGFSALRHKLHWYGIIMTPLVFCAMVLVAAVFSLRLPRRGKMALMVFGAVVAGFTLNFMTGLFNAFGYAGSLPVEIAVIAPHLLAVMISMVLLLHYEDG